MKAALLPIALLLASAGAQAHDSRGRVQVGCDIHSDYSISTYRSAFLFQRDEGPARKVGIGGGRLFVDGKEIHLSNADAERIAQFERELRELTPEVQHVSREAVEIAFTALIEVARGLSSDPDDTIASLERSRRQALDEIRSNPLAVFNDESMEDMVEPILTRFVPDVAGGAVSAGLRAAFAGEVERRKFQMRMDRMKHELDTRVDARAKDLEPLADAMCRRLERMDALDDALEYRLPRGESLQFLEIDNHRHKD